MSTFCWLLLPLLLLVADAKVFEFRVRRFESERVSPLRKLASRMAVKAYHEAERVSRLYNRQREDSWTRAVVGRQWEQEVYDYYDMEYVAAVSIGTPPQEFEIVLDTGSANLWVPDSSCDYTQACDKMCKMPFYCNPNCDEYCCGKLSKVSSCDQKHKFESKRSKTYVKHGQAFKIAYGTGFVDGFLGMDTVRFGGATDTNALSVPNTFIGQATTLGKFFRGVPMDGILGLAYRSIAVDGVAPPLMNAMAQGLLDEPMFSVFLETEGPDAAKRPGGVFTWGGLDTQNCGPVIGWAPLTHQTYYEFQIEGVSYGSGKYVSKKRQKVISDTGTSLIIGTKSIVNGIVKAIGGMQWDKEAGLYTLPCDKQYEPVVFTINGEQYSLPREVLSISAGDADDKNLCIFAMVPYSSWGFGPDWILGDPFIRQYCNVHDIGNKRMGFARAIQPKH